LHRRIDDYFGFFVSSGLIICTRSTSVSFSSI